MQFSQAISVIFEQVFSTWVERLQHRFARLSRALIEDAISDAFTQALSRPAFKRALRDAGIAGLEKLLQIAAWRAVNTARRTRVRRGELLRQRALRAEDDATPEGLLMAQEAHYRLLALLPKAARRFGGRRPERLEAALNDRVLGFNDTEAAERNGVRREAVNRAWRSLCKQVHPR